MLTLYSKKILQPGLNLRIKNKCVTVTHFTRNRNQCFDVNERVDAK